MVILEFGKRDCFLFALFLLLFGAGYGSGDPSVMGHTGGEIEVTDDFCIRITGHDCGYDEVLSFDLVNGVHSTAQCNDLGGVVRDVSEGKVCKFSGSSCPNGWYQFKGYSTTKANSCSCPYASVICDDCGSGHSCNTGYHPFSNNNVVETCYYYMDDTKYAADCDWSSPKTCTATRTEIGCY